MAPHIKTLESKLKDLGYTHSWQLIKSDADVLDLPDTPLPTIDSDEHSPFYQALLDNTRKPLCQAIDVVVPLRDDERSQEEKASYRQFLEIVGPLCPEQSLRFINNKNGSDTNTANTTSHIADRLAFTCVQDDEKRQMAIEELIDTENTYVDKLRTTVKLFTQKLNPQNHAHRRIIEPYDYKKIFSNIEDLLAVNEKFLLDLFNSSTSNTGPEPPAGGAMLCFGEVCASHLASFVDCYRTYLLNYITAQLFHASVMKNNFDYRRFIYDVLNDPRCENKALFDYLIEPPQRIGRYTMLLKNILIHTSPEHPDYAPLTRAFAKANEIALLADDEATKMATMCYSFFNSVKRAPCTMLSQHRTPIAYIDASELHRETSKPKRPVTIVLLSDKILVVERPNYNSRGIDLGDPADTSLDGFLSRNLSKDPSLKFRGWVDIEQVQFFKGAPGMPESFLISASTAQQHGPGPLEPADNSDAYFRSGGPRLFQAAVRSEAVQKMNEFIKTCERAQALMRRYDMADEARHRQWSDTNIYANLYDTMTYTRATYKNNIAVVYVEQEKPTNIKSLFRGAGSATPWVVALVQGRHKERNRRDGFRFSIMTKVPLKPSRRIIHSIPCAASTSSASDGCGGSHVIRPNGKSVPFFSRVFWDNLIYCEWHLRHSSEFIHEHEAVLEPHQRTRRRSRSRSLSRSTSFTTLSNLFSGGGGSRSRSMSPSRQETKPESSHSSPTSAGRTTPKEFFSTFARKSRSRSSSMTSGGDKSINSIASSTTTVGTGTENDMTQQSRNNDVGKYGLPSSLVLSDILTRRPLATGPQESKLPGDVTTASPNQISYFSGGPTLPSNPFTPYSLPETQHPLRNERDSDYSNQPPYLRRMSSRSSSRSPSTTEAEADYLHSRPSSQNSTRSSTPSLGFSNRTPSPHSNTMTSSVASYSTRSSLSFDDYEVSPKPALHRPGSTQDSATDAIRKIQELLSSQNYYSGNANTGLNRPAMKNNMTSMRLPERTNGFVVSSIPNEPSRDRNLHPATDKCRSLSEQILHGMMDSLQARANDTDPEQSYTVCNQINADLENIAAAVGSIRQERRPPAMMDAEAEIARKVRQAQAERDHWERYLNDIKTKAAKMSHRQSM